MTRIKCCLIASLSIVFISCQAEVDDIIEETKSCKIITGMYYGGSGGLNDSTSFIYDANGKLVKIEAQYGYYTFHYSGDKLIARRYYENMDLLWEDSVKWDGNSVSEFIQYDYSSGVSPELARYLMYYSGGRLSKIEMIDMYPDWVNGGMLVDTFPTNVYWNPAGNIERLVFYDEFGDAVDSISYQYDNNTNFFKVVHPHFYLFDPMFELHAGFEPHLPYFYSKNNVTGFTIYDGFNYDISYGLDSLNQVSEVKMDGFDYMKYKYRCD